MGTVIKSLFAVLLYTFRPEESYTQTCEPVVRDDMVIDSLEAEIV